MVGLRRVFDDPRFLVHDSSVRREVARSAALPVCGVTARVDGNVGCVCIDHATMASNLSLSSELDLGRCGSAVRLWAVHLFAILKEL